MASVTGLTAARMLEIEANCIVDGGVVVNNLILTRQDGSTIDAGSVRGPTGSPGLTSGEFATAMNDNMPIGTIVDYMGTVSPSASWLTMVGQTVANAQTLYPTWWSRIPASMKSGSSAIMPNTQGKVSIGLNSADTDFDTIAEVGGAKTHILTQAEMPVANVTIDPPSTTITIDPPATIISINPPNTAVTGNTGGASDETPNDNGGWFAKNFGALGSSGGTLGAYGAQGFDDGTVLRMAHTHTSGSLAVDIGAFNATVDISPFSATVDIAPFFSNALGLGQAMSLVQPYVVFLKLVKVL